MLTGRAAAERPEVNDLAPRSIPLAVEPAPRCAVPGEFAERLKLSARQRHERRTREAKTRNAGRDIPTSGSGRRRAKNRLRCGLCLAIENSRWCELPALDGTTRCERHQKTKAA